MSPPDLNLLWPHYWPLNYMETDQSYTTHVRLLSQKKNSRSSANSVLLLLQPLVPYLASNPLHFTLPQRPLDLRLLWTQY